MIFERIRLGNSGNSIWMDEWSRHAAHKLPLSVSVGLRSLLISLRPKAKIFYFSKLQGRDQTTPSF